ncbi:MAG: tetratricopeptide repeat protein, partial [Planctomycetaceae bacterium]|nr:tetratricopeptide repeat protein [Planctomycetaceae bacterium]
MTHEQAGVVIEQHSGDYTHHVSRNTTLLVIGEEGWPLEEDGKPSLKLQHAEELIQYGHEIRIVSESDWLSMMGLFTDDPEIKRLYTPAMLSQLLKLPVHLIRGWERAGLIRAEKKVCRLPYFNYHEVTSARRLSDLLSCGATQEELTQSMQMLNKFLPDPGRILEQLEILSDQHHLVIRDQHGVYEPLTRQRLFSFAQTEGEPSCNISEEDFPEDDQEAHLLRFDLPTTKPATATDWMVEGCRRTEVSDTDSAIRCFRQALRVRSDDAEAHFYLADALYRIGKPDAALERYLAAIENDPEYLEAWIQIGCLYTEITKWTESLLAFDEALHIFPDFPEAHLQKAETLRLMNRIDDAVVHWKLYLKHDERGPWSELAHQRLEQAGVSVDN